MGTSGLLASEGVLYASLVLYEIEMTGNLQRTTRHRALCALPKSMREISPTGYIKLTVACTSADKNGVERYTRLANVFSKQIMRIWTDKKNQRMCQSRPYLTGENDPLDTSESKP